MRTEIKVTAPEPSAEAFDTALRAAAMSPQMRLEMILGEAYRKYLDLAGWVRDEIEKDEAKAPGLIATAAQLSVTPDVECSGRSDPVRIALSTQRVILMAAFELDHVFCDDAPRQQLTQEPSADDRE